MINPKLLKQFLVEPGTGVDLNQYVTDWTETDKAKELGKDVIKERAAGILEESSKELAAAQELLYAADIHSVLIVLQAMAAAGKDALTATSTKRAPWWIIPTDRKYVARALIADIITTSIQDLGLEYPKVDEAKMARLAAAREKLEKLDKEAGD